MKHKIIGSKMRQGLLCGISGAGTGFGMSGLCIGAAGMLALMAPQRAAAFTYDDGGWEVNLTTNVQYNGAVRVGKPSAVLLSAVNSNDGDENFKHGMVSNQFEVLPILSVTNGNFGLHMSGEAFLDPSYLQRNTNDSPETLNYTVTNNRNFPRSTQNIDGRNAELLDAFAYDSVSFGANDAQSITVKVGRQTLLWGQSLFFTGNGIAGGQAPIDVNTAETLANPQAQQIFLPVGQVVFTYQPNDWITLQGYYQFEWRPDQFPGAGSYYSPADFFVPGGTRLIVGSSPAGQVYLGRTADRRPPSNNGQFGISAKFTVGNYDIGFYALRFDEKSPDFYSVSFANGPRATPEGLEAGYYASVYARDIQIYGTSLSTNVGPVNVAGEISTRRHQDLDSGFATITPGLNENSNPGYAVGNTINGQVSAIYLSPALPLMPGGLTAAGEIEANRVVSVTANKDNLTPGRTPGGIGMQGTLSPTYYNVIIANLNISPSIGLTWYPTGRSQFLASEQAGTGQLNIGGSATYDVNWTAGVNFADYLGSKDKQGMADKNYFSFYVQRTF